MEGAVVVGGAVLEAAAWWLVAARRRDVWRVTVPVLLAMAAAALAVGPPSWSPRADPALALAAGIAAGAALYLGTRLFVGIVRPWRAFQAHSVAMYRRQGSRAVGWALVLSAALASPAEEVFWRGFAQPELADALGRRGVAAVAAWALFVAANAPSANLAIMAGAMVGGGVWAALGWWCGGALAPLASHAAWTALMVALPVVPRSELAT